MLLVHVCQFHGLSYLESTFVYGFQSHNQAEQGSLAGTVRTDYTDNAVRGQHEIQVIEQQLVTISFLAALLLDLHSQRHSGSSA